MSQPTRKTVLSAAQTTGILTIGNYLGAIRHWVRLIEDHDCFFPLVDMHAITTTPYVPAQLRKHTRSLAAQYIACGLDPKKCALFIQSHVVGHAELAWVLGCLTPVGDLQRMTQFKDKIQKGTPINSGLLFYPVLMAADILLYNADMVPVGEDQKQHLELVRNLADRFNNTYSKTFTVPEPKIPSTASRIMSLQNPQRKMSKSDPNQGSYILLTDEPDQIRKKIGRAVTDSGREIRPGPDKPGITNLLSIMSGFTEQSIEACAAQFAGKGYRSLKETVADVVMGGLEPIRTRYNDIIADPAHLDSVLKAGADAAQKRAFRMLGKVYRKVGFVERFR